MNNQLNDEIDLIEIFKKIYNSKKIIIYSTILLSVIGIAYAIMSPIKFESSTVFIPQNQEGSNSSSLSGVASLVGLNLGTSSYGGDIQLSMYPQIGESPKFKRQLLEQIIDKKNNLSLKDFFIENYEIENDENVNNFSPLYITNVEEICFKLISSIISISVNQKDGFVTISSNMANAEYSAIIANLSKEILQNIIIENKIETARQNLNFSKKQLIEKRLEFDEIQSKLAYFSDSNLNTVNSFVINEKDKLEAEFDIINAVVTELSKQVEQAKLQVTKDTPVFSTIKEATIPKKRTSPKRKQIVITFAFIGLISSIIFVLIAEPLNKIFIQIKSK